MLVFKKRSWLSMILAVRGELLARIWPRLLLVTLVATAVTIAHELWGILETGLTIAPFSLIGLALSIFLGFRNSTSYDRFWEASKLWGALVNTTRTTARQIQMLVTPRDEVASDGALAELHRELVYRVIAFVHCFRHHLRNEAHPGDAAAFLPEDEAAALSRQSNPPQLILHTLGSRFRDLWKQGLVQPMHLTVLQTSLASLTDIQGACERIKSTPIPASHTVLIHRLVAHYVLALPFGLVGTIGLYTPGVVALIAYAFLGLDALGDEIEEPFGVDLDDLPLTTLSRMIEVNLRERLGETDLPPLLQPVDRRLL